MSHVVFLRAANVGGRNVFRPASLAAGLAHLDVVNVGAVGTFVVRGKATPAAIRRQILAQLAFEPAIVVRPASDILELVASDPFRGSALSRDRRGWAAVLAGTPKTRPNLPVSTPAGSAWSVRLDRLENGFALGIWRRSARGFAYPSDFVEETLGVPATTRYWETFLRLATVLAASP